MGWTWRVAAAVRLHRGRNRIRILAAAPGFVATRSWVVVRYRPHDHNPPGPSFVDRVNAVCHAFRNQDALLAISGTSLTGRAAAYRIAAMIDQELARFRAVRAPPRQRAAFGAFLAVQTGLSDQYHALLAARTVGQARAVVMTLVANAKRRDSIAYAVGFRECDSLIGNKALQATPGN